MPEEQRELARARALRHGLGRRPQTDGLLVNSRQGATDERRLAHDAHDEGRDR